MKTKHYLQSGQVGIIAILVAIVIFTLGMSVAARVVIDTRISARAEEGARAHAAAESALEIALSQSIEDLANMVGTGPSAEWSDNELVRANYEVSAKPITNEEFRLDPLFQGETRTIWLVHLTEQPQGDPFASNINSYDEDFLIYWDGSDTSTRVEVALYYHDESADEEVSVWRQYRTRENSVRIDPDDPNYSPPGYDPAEDHFYLIRLKMITGNGDRGIYVLPAQDSSDSFPIQELEITANGWTTFDQNQIRRRTVAKRKVGDIPAIFDYVLANTGGDLLKN